MFDRKLLSSSKDGPTTKILPKKETKIGANNVHIIIFMLNCPKELPLNGQQTTINGFLFHYIITKPWLALYINPANNYNAALISMPTLFLLSS